MNEGPSRIDAELEASLRRIAGALQQNRSQYAAAVEKIVTVASAEVGAKLEEKAERMVRRHERRRQHSEEQRRRREERRREREDEGGELGKGLVFGIVAVICVLYAIREPAFFWMVFVALGFGISSASLLAKANKRRQEARATAANDEAGATEQESVLTASPGTKTPPVVETGLHVPPIPVPSVPADPKVARIQALCDKLLAELQSGPPIVREVLTEPAATISGLRQACLQTARRERELRDVLETQDEASLLRERDALAGRLANEADEIVRDRLAQALRALEGQLANRAELATSAMRLEAENTRILYTLENLHMQLLRARTTDIGGPELGGRLREGLRELGTQIDAVAEALECASAPVTPVAAPDAPPATTPVLASDEAQRAERAEAARRAASAQQAQRR